MVGDRGDFMKQTLFSCAIAALAALSFTGCSSAPTEAPKKVETKKEPPKPVTGQTAIFAMYQVARSWAPDVKILKVEPIEMEDVASEPGKAGAWRATFVSLAKRQRRDYTYAVADMSQSITKGVRAGTEGLYAANPQQFPFFVQDLKVDSDKAIEGAKTNKEIKAYADANPASPIVCMLEWTSTTPRPAWRVIWGRSVSTAAASAFVDAGDGKFIKKLR